MTSLISHVAAAQQAAALGQQPREILRLLLEQVKPRWDGHIPRIDIEHCLMQAFDIPLRVVRDIEPWKGFDEKGNVTDQDIDALLGPWITRYMDSREN